MGHFWETPNILLPLEFSPVIESKNPSKARTLERTAGVLGRYGHDVHSCECLADGITSEGSDAHDLNVFHENNVFKH